MNRCFPFTFLPANRSGNQVDLAPPRGGLRSRAWACALLSVLLPWTGCEKAKELADNAVNKVKEDFKSAKEKLEQASQPEAGEKSKTQPVAPVSAPTIAAPGSPTSPGQDDRGLSLEQFERLVPSTIRDSHLEDLLKDPAVAATVTRLKLSNTGITANGLALLSQFPNLEELDLTRVSVTAGNMQHVGDIGSLKILSLADNSLGDSDLLEIASLTKLESINLRGNRITDEGFRCFSQMPNLAVMIVEGLTQLEGKGFKYVNKNSLRELYGNGSSIGLAAFQSLGGSESLEIIWLNGARVTDQAMRGIGSCGKLKELFLEGNDLTNKGISQLRNTVSLVKLDLAGNRRLGDDTVQYLTRLENLKHLNLRSTRCTGATETEMLKHVPDCQVYY